MKPPVDAPTSIALRPSTPTSKRASAFASFTPAARNEPWPLAHAELGVHRHHLARLLRPPPVDPDGHLPRHHRRGRPRPRREQPALGQQGVQALLWHERWQDGSRWRTLPVRIGGKFDPFGGFGASVCTSHKHVFPSCIIPLDPKYSSIPPPRNGPPPQRAVSFWSTAPQPTGADSRARIAARTRSAMRVPVKPTSSCRSAGLPCVT